MALLTHVQNQHDIVGRHLDDLVEPEAVAARDLVDGGGVSDAPVRVLPAQRAIEVRVA